MVPPLSVAQSLTLRVKGRGGGGGGVVGVRTGQWSAGMAFFLY